MTGLKRVSIQGKPYAVLYDMYGLAHVMEQSGCNFGEILEKAGRFANYNEIGPDDVRFIYDLIYAGFINGAEETGEDFPFTKRQLSRLVPLVGNAITEIMEEFQKGMTTSIGIDDQKKAPSKTKVKKLAKT